MSINYTGIPCDTSNPGGQAYYCTDICDNYCSRQGYTSIGNGQCVQRLYDLGYEQYCTCNCSEGISSVPSIPRGRRGIGYNKGGRVNSNRSRFSGRTQNNPKGRSNK
tara:strand:- start:81 stop:401 length:321 start_codon:yes stop_codon:yes gene_type:complete